TRVICDAMAARKPSAVLMTVSSTSRDLAGRVAMRSGAALASDCTALSAEGDGFKLVRPILAGRALVTAVHASPAPLLATLRPNVFTAEKPAQSAAGAVEALTVADDSKDARVTVKSFTPGGGTRPEL